MARVNWRRVWLGAFVGGVTWLVWSTIIGLAVVSPRYVEAQRAGWFLSQPRYPFFMAAWVVMLFVLAFVLAWLYAGVRAVHGAGPSTAVMVGLAVGFAAGFPMNFALATWAPFDRVFPLWWMLELWIGAILAALTAGWVYRD